MNLRPRLCLLSAVAIMPLWAIACSLPADEQVTPIDADDLGDLANPTTTATTPPTTTPPQTGPTSAPTTTTTVVELTTERQRLFYTIGSSDDLKRVTITLAQDADFRIIQNQLESPSTEVRSLGYATDVRPGLIDDFRFSAETVTLTVALNAAVFDSMSETEVRNAIGQIVLTFTLFAPVDTGGIGFVNFTIDGSPISVFVPRSSSASEVGQPLTFADFQPLLGSTGVPAGTAPPSTSPITEPPASTIAPTTVSP